MILPNFTDVKERQRELQKIIYERKNGEIDTETYESGNFRLNFPYANLRSE